MKSVPISKLKPNTANPRSIEKPSLDKLVKSIKEFPEMLNARPIVVNKDMVVLGGNMRLQALQQAGIEKVNIQIVDWTKEQEQEFIIKDNVAFGEWDWDILADEWNSKELSDWGLAVWQTKDDIELDDFFNENKVNEETELKTVNTWNDLFIEYVREHNLELYKKASKHAEENQ